MLLSLICLCQVVTTEQYDQQLLIWGNSASYYIFLTVKVFGNFVSEVLFPAF